MHIPPGAIAVQVGEAAQILAGGRLAATAHCVLRPAASGPRDRGPHVSRQTFVVFCQPPWAEPLVAVGGGGGAAAEVLAASSPSTSVLAGACACALAAESTASCVCPVAAPAGSPHRRLLPPLSERWESGITFSDFSTRTTRAYYGPSGVQAAEGGAATGRLKGNGAGTKS